MGTKKSKNAKKLEKAKKIVKKINGDLIDASFKAIETSVKAGEKWQKLTAKLIKKAEPLTKQQMNMFVDTAETIKEQVESSTERLKNLVGYDPKMVEQAKKMVIEHPVVEKAEAIKDKIENEVANNKLVKKAEKMSKKLKKEITDTIDDVKEKIEDYTEDIIDDVKDKVEDVIGTKKATKKKTAKKTTKKVSKKTAPKASTSSATKASAKKTTAKKTTAKASTSSATKAPAKKVVAKKTPAKKTVAKKAPVKTSTSSATKAPAKPVAKVEVIVVEKTSVKNDLKVIKGIGPKLEETLNKQGLTAYDQMAKMTIKDLTTVLNQAGANAKMYNLSDWKAQAKLAVKGDMDAVKNWTAKK